jgi:hypothetical protein
VQRDACFSAVSVEGGIDRDLAEPACAQFGCGLREAAWFDDESPALLQGLMHAPHMPQTAHSRQILLPSSPANQQKRKNNLVTDILTSKAAVH